jgi:nucleotide-binding universal stress UspA family protein
MRFHKILCPIDFSPGSDRALHHAVELARHHQAELVIVHAWFLPPNVYASELAFPAVALDQLVRDVDRSLELAVGRAVQLGAPRVSGRTLAGAAPGEIDRALAEDPSFDLVVIGTHGRTGVRRILLGSVAEKVVRHAPCSVLAVHDTDELRPFRSALCPIDFSERSREAIALAGAILEPPATITLLHVVEAPVSYAGDPHTDGFVEDLDRRAAALLERWAAEARAKTGATVVTRSRVGAPGVQTLSVLGDDPGFDVVVIGSHGRTGLRRVLLGSVAEKVVRHAGRPVLVARTRE